MAPPPQSQNPRARRHRAPAPRVDVFALGPDFSMRQQTTWNGALETGGWIDVGGVFTSAPAAIAWNGDRIDVFGVGLDAAMYQRTVSGSSISQNWERLGGNFNSEAHPVSWGKNRLDVFARGVDYTLRHRSSNGASWETDWENLGGSLASPPFAVSWGADRLDVFVIGSDGQLWHRWWDGEIWNDWESLPLPLYTPSFGSPPVAVALAPGRLDVFATGTDGMVRHIAYQNDSWGPWRSFGGVMTAGPTAIAAIPGQIDLFAPSSHPGTAPHRLGRDRLAAAGMGRHRRRAGEDATALPFVRRLRAGRHDAVAAHGRERRSVLRARGAIANADRDAIYRRHGIHASEPGADQPFVSRPGGPSTSVSRSCSTTR
jgi:hypothetical protein